MYLLFVILIVLAAVLMIGIVLIQESKGGGLSSNFASSNSMLGVRKTTDVIEKTTWTLAAAMVLLSVLCAHVAPKAATEQSVLEQSAPAAPSTPTAGFGASEQTEEAAPAADAKEAAAPAETPAPAEKPAETPAN
ncbi:MAG: preprotein translocase subunit SecG [Prevotella sp.]|jgi:preprotein translocase subunit SecG|nr:preprotein translocase subunit SecG [Prevotella sp.]MBQ6161531.1 preprotein translocase subunit SecG [Prevotella sp.]